MPWPNAIPDVAIESDEPVAGTRDRVAAIRVRGLAGGTEAIQHAKSALMGLRYGASVTTTPVPGRDDGFFVVHYQGTPLTRGEVQRAIRS